AFEVHGAIYGRWSSLGFERSYLGYPVSDETPTTLPTLGPGRINSFQFGRIYWSQTTGAITELPATVQPDPQPITTPEGTPLGGSVNMILKSNGDYTVTFHMHDSGIPSYDFSVAAIFTTPGGLTIAASYEGHVEGTGATTFTHAPNRDSDGAVSGSNPMIRMHWADIRGGRLWATKDYSATGLIGFAEDVVKFVLDVTATVAGIGIGVVIGLAMSSAACSAGLGLAAWLVSSPDAL
ncbi:MAG: hypothetical protein KGN84_11140, partial [Acidobacteriota bacterium]|nr:hypothetical protein [Acidobacteriota bacterium]